MIPRNDGLLRITSKKQVRERERAVLLPINMAINMNAIAHECILGK